VLLIPIKYRKKIEDFLLEFSSFTLLNEMSDKFINEVIRTGRKTPDQNQAVVLGLKASLEKQASVDKPNCMLYGCRVESYLSEVENPNVKMGAKFEELI
jgi:hypothetical protein